MHKCNQLKKFLDRQNEFLNKMLLLTVFGYQIFSLEFRNKINLGYV
jgi:hypothetical protein